MPKRVKKPAIKPEQRLDWLRRYEGGESPPKIAENDNFDVRTVRKHLDLARQQAEVKDARAVVLRNALERHYSDLCSYAATLARQTSGETAAGALQSEYLHAALRQHLPRSPVWGYLNQESDLHRQISQLKQEGGKRIEEAVNSARRLKSALTKSETGVMPGIIESLKFQLEQWAKGYNGLDIKTNLISERPEGGSVNLRYGFSQLGRVPVEHVAIIREALKKLEKRLKKWAEFKKLEKAFVELGRVEKKLKDEIAVITLRRIVPGRCRYCPI